MKDFRHSQSDLQSRLWPRLHSSTSNYSLYTTTYAIQSVACTCSLRHLKLSSVLDKSLHVQGHSHQAGQLCLCRGPNSTELVSSSQTLMTHCQPLTPFLSSSAQLWMLGGNLKVISAAFSSTDGKHHGRLSHQTSAISYCGVITCKTTTADKEYSL